jgi:triacylglycerol lipase
MSSRNPVLLIHGLDDTVSVFTWMIAYLRDRGWTDIHAINLSPNNGDAGLETLAEQVHAYVESHIAYAEAIDLVGFSMGGLVSRYYVQRLQQRRVENFVTLASPHQGTWTGYLRQNPGACQMRPGSAFLNDLNRTAYELQQVTFTSFWTPYDLMIVPANSSQLGVGTMVQLPVLAHPLMVIDDLALEAVAATLEKAPIPRRHSRNLVSRFTLQGHSMIR